MQAASAFELLAAIDLRGGRVVRLRQGDFDRETTYGTDPPAVARRFLDAGATWLHLVDLDGAKAGEPIQASPIASVIAAVAGVARVEVGGGFRTMSSIERVLSDGATRVVLGTAVLRDPGFARRAVAGFGSDRICVGLDVRAGRAAVEAWTADGDATPVERVLATLADAGVTTFEVTAVERDGMLTGPDLDLLDSLVRLGRGRIIASGGIATLDDLGAVHDVGCAGAIVGRALYEGTIDLAAAATMMGEGVPS